MCAVGCDGSSSSENEAEAEPHDIWNPLLSAMVHFRIGDMLQPSFSAEDLSKVALTCRFACDSLCEELHDWEGAERGWSQPAEGWQNRRRCRNPQ